MLTMADQQPYTTTLHDHGWWCNCPGAFAGNPDEVMPTRDAVDEVDNHVGYYSDTWRHTVVDNTTDQVWPNRVAEEWCAEAAAQERAELLALTADKDDDVDGRVMETFNWTVDIAKSDLRLAAAAREAGDTVRAAQLRNLAALQRMRYIEQLADRASASDVDGDG